MSSINPLQGNRPVQATALVNAAQQAQLNPIDQPAPTRAADRLELSGLSPLLQKAKVEDVRTDKVADVRQQIASGTYETPEKVDAAIDRLLDELA